MESNKLKEHVLHFQMRICLQWPFKHGILLNFFLDIVESLLNITTKIHQTNAYSKEHAESARVNTS